MHLNRSRAPAMQGVVAGARAQHREARSARTIIRGPSEVWDDEEISIYR